MESTDRPMEGTHPLSIEIYSLNWAKGATHYWKLFGSLMERAGGYSHWAGKETIAAIEAGYHELGIWVPEPSEHTHCRVNQSTNKFSTRRIRSFQWTWRPMQVAGSIP